MPAEIRLSREMRLVDITMIGVGAMIGAGIFVLTGIAAGVAGPALLLVFFLNGIVNGLSARVAEGLEEEGFSQARLFAKSLKGALLALVAALGLWQLEFARQVVLAAFLIAFGSVGVAFALAVGIGSARAIERAWEIVFRNKRKDPS